MIGARHDDFKADYQRTAAAGSLSRTDRVWSYRTGVIYQPTDTASYYASYGTSFNPSGELYALDDRSTNTPPEKNRNIEFGAKWDLLDGNLMFRTALFRSEKTNERNTDLSNTGLTENLLSGKRHTDGIEFETAGRITPRWGTFGGLEAAGKRYGNTTNTNAAPSYVRWDGMLEYVLEKYTIKLNVFNLFNQTYYDGIYAGHVVPGATRSAQLTLSAKF